mgnify:CR=1 FL=1
MAPTACGIKCTARFLECAMTLPLPALLDQIHTEAQALYGKGRVADYIPALGEVPPRQFGMAVALVSGESHTVGDAQVPFSLQSITKLFTFVIALKLMGEGLWQRVGREPSGAAFNSIVQLETENGIPRNPFINAGALVITDILTSRYAHLDYALLGALRAAEAVADARLLQIEGRHDTFLAGDADILLAHDCPARPLHEGLSQHDRLRLRGDRFQPYAAISAGDFGFPGTTQTPFPLIAYAQRAYFADLFEHVLSRNEDRPAYRMSVQCDMSDVLKEVIVAGHGVGWLPESAVDPAAAALIAANIAKSPSPPEMVTVPRARDVVFPALTVVINASARSRAIRIA